MIRQQILKTIYPSVVTYKARWRDRLKEVAKFKLTDISLFLTCADLAERKAIYKALAKSAVKRILHVHARDDMLPIEYELLMKKYGTKAFSLHYLYLDAVEGKQYRDKVFVENNIEKDAIGPLGRIRRIGGVCVDLSHYAEFKSHRPELHAIDKKTTARFTVGCNHVSAVDRNGYSQHAVRSLDDLSYLAAIPRKCFSKYLCLELANPIAEQLQFREHIATLLSNTWNKR